MKNIEDKLDGFEQVLAILVKKISVLESLLADPKVPVDDLIRQMLAEIQASMAKIPSGNLMLFELTGIRKRIDALSDAQDNRKPVVFDFNAKSYLLSLAVLVSMTVASLSILKLSDYRFEQSRRAAVRYEAAQQLAPRLTRLIDHSFDQPVAPSLDSLQRTWELMNFESRKSNNGRRKKR